jgi:16S rRNA (guanine1207-N2)-methyltransferase
LPEHYYTETPTSEITTFLIKPIIRNRFYQFKTSSGVFSYKKADKGTLLLLKYLQIPPNASDVLDMGTGYGIIGIVIATEFPQVQVKMIDINQRAVWIARENLKLNKISNAKVYWGDFYDPIKKEKQKFDLIVTNPPLALGHKINFEFISRTPPYLKSGGHLDFVVQTRKGAQKFAEKMNETFGNVELVAIQSGYRLFRSKL